MLHLSCQKNPKVSAYNAASSLPDFNKCLLVVCVCVYMYIYIYTLSFARIVKARTSPALAFTEFRIPGLVPFRVQGLGKTPATFSSKPFKPSCQT